MGAITSITSSASACSALMLTASVTNDSATSALRSCSSAIARIDAAASFTALSEPDGTVDADRGRRSDVRAGRHGRDVAGEQHERSGRGGARPRRGDVADHGHARVQDRLGDLTGRGDESPGRVDLDQHGGTSPASAASAMPSLEVVGDEGIDDAVELQPGDRRSARRLRRTRPRSRSEAAPSTRPRTMDVAAISDPSRVTHRVVVISVPWIRHMLRFGSPSRTRMEPSLDAGRTSCRPRGRSTIDAVPDGGGAGKPRSSEAPYTGRNTGCKLATTDRSSRKRNSS